MSDRSIPPGIHVLRAFAAASIAADGLRATARKIGVQPYGLQYFVDGGKPQTKTLRKLENWYLGNAPASAQERPDEIALVAVGLLLRDLPAQRQAEALQRSATFYRELYKALGTARPAWLKALDEKS